MRCSSCGADNPATNTFCGRCGGSLPRRCSACGQSNPPSNRYCGECGEPLVAAVATGTSAEVGARGSPTTPRTPSPQTPSGAEERRPVTVLFADLVGFTALSERLDAEDVRDITTECFRRLVAEVGRYEGTIDKFIGDAVMALFGAPVTHENDPARALWAALAMQRALARFNDELERERGLRLGLRIGIESGEVVAGVRDLGGVREYTVIGDAVNVAARLQAATEPGTILVGAATERRAGGAFAFRSIPPLTLKGKEQPVAASVLLGSLAPLEAEDATFKRVGRAPLVGRTEELRTLERCLLELRRGRGQIAIVVGEPGLGKSRLLAELRANGDGVNWARCQAFAHEGALSYGLARSLVRRLCDLQEDEPEAVATERLHARLEALDCPAAYPWLAHLLTLPLEAEETQRSAGLPPEELQRLAFDAVANLVAQLAAGGPLVLELDDLHWADPTSVDLLLKLLELAERAPILFCCALRPEREAPAWALRERAARDYPHRHIELLLHPISEAASAELMAGLLHLDELPPGLRGVLERAAGTPLWVEELVRTLIERGLLVADDGRWRVTADLDRVEIPDTLQALIVARIDRLGDARSTVQTAAVIGRRFGQRVLERVAYEQTQLDEHLLRAQRVDLVRELQVVPEREYGFKHVLTQEAAYATLLVRRRRELHRAVAEALEALYPERVDELHAVLAHHYQRAEAWPEALGHARLAAESARASYANREALEHYAVALVAAEQAGLGPDERMQLYEARAAVYEVTGEFEPARCDYEAALALAESGNAVARARLLGALGMLWGGHKDYQRGLEFARQAARAAQEANDSRALVEARVQVGAMLLNLAQMTESRREFEAALALFRELGDETGQARTLDLLCMVNLCAGDHERAIEYGREAIDRLRVLGDRPTEASAMNSLGISLGYLGQLPEAEEWLRRSLEVWIEIGGRGGEAYTHWNIAEIVEPLGEYERALGEAHLALDIARDIDHREWIAAALSNIGRVHRACGDLVGARKLHEDMLVTARELGTGLWITDALGELGQDRVLAGDEAGAAALLAEAVATGHDAHKFTARALLAQAELELRQGRSSEALSAARHLQEVLAHLPVLVIDAYRTEGEALAALGHYDAAEVALGRAITHSRSLGARPPHWRARLALADLLDRTDRADEAVAERAVALTLLETVANELSDPDLRRSFAESEPMRWARESAGRGQAPTSSRTPTAGPSGTADER